jgi:hypothetical protein
MIAWQKPMKPDDFKNLVNEIGSLIDKRAETTEISIKAHVSKEIAASEERQTKRLEDAKEELRAEILTSRAEAKADNLRLSGKVDKVTRSQETRLKELEEERGIHNRDKN